MDNKTLIYYLYFQEDLKNSLEKLILENHIIKKLDDFNNKTSLSDFDQSSAALMYLWITNNGDLSDKEKYQVS